MIPREIKLPRDYEVMDLVLQRGDAVELARNIQLFSLVITKVAVV